MKTLDSSLNHKNTTFGKIPSHWKIAKLGNLIYIKGRIGWRNLKKSEYVEKGYAIFTGRMFKDDELDWEKCERITEERYLESSEIILEENDILVTKDGTIGKVAYIYELKEPATIAGHIFLIRSLSDDVLQRFLFYFFNSHFFQQLIQTRTEGSVVPALYQRDIVELKIPLPSIQEQNWIIEILDSITYKIKLNQKMNLALESLAQSLFHSWFVRFDPFQEEEFVDSELGPIPKGWEVGKLSEVAAITMGQSPPGESYNEEGRGIVFYQGNKDFGIRFPTPRVFTSDPKRIANENDILISVRAPIGSLNIAREKCCIGRGIAALSSRTMSYSFVYYLMKSFEKRWRTYESQGTVFGSLKRDDLESMKFIKPPVDLIDRFNELINSIDIRIKNCSYEILFLSSLRDLLLPQLLSGRLRIKNPNRFSEVINIEN